MKAKFLKRSESEKSDKVKVIFEVETSDIANQLEKGQAYEIEPYEAKLPNMAPSAKELLKQAQALISQATGVIPEEREPVLPLSCDKKDEKCGNCATWERIQSMPPGFEVPQGDCMNPDSGFEVVPIYHWCSHWRSREENKDEVIAKTEIREGLAGEERVDEGVHDQDGD